MEAGGVIRQSWTYLLGAVSVIAGAIVLALLATSHTSSASALPSPARTLSIDCPAPALGGKLPAAVYLPAGYRNSSLRYPVIYFLHGLPAGPESYLSNGFVASAVADGDHRAIVVAPQGAPETNSDREYLDWSPTENWPKAIADELVRCIDARFRTIASRSGRALVGLSAGGFGAFNIGLRNLQTFAAIESWSGYFAATDPTGLVTLDLGSARADRRARVPRGRHLHRKLSQLRTFVAFYVGSADARFLKANIALDEAFTRHHIPHLFRIYPGGHSNSLWERWARLWLGLALTHMARAE